MSAADVVLALTAIALLGAGASHLLSPRELWVYAAAAASGLYLLVAGTVFLLNLGPISVSGWQSLVFSLGVVVFCAGSVRWVIVGRRRGSKGNGAA